MSRKQPKAMPARYRLTITVGAYYQGDELVTRAVWEADSSAPRVSISGRVEKAMLDRAITLAQERRAALVGREN